MWVELLVSAPRGFSAGIPPCGLDPKPKFD